jgi:hypothetical protein
MLPDFTADGVLPPGDYVLTIQELRGSPLVIGPSNPARPTWDQAWRSKLVDNLEILVNQLFAVGIADIFIAGSFVEVNKDRPGDIDGYFVCDLLRFGAMQNQLNTLDPHQAWDWDHRVPDRYDPSKTRTLMWHHYNVELFPHFSPPFDRPCGVLDEVGNPQTFPAAFRKTRGFIPRGIVKIGAHP